MFVFVSFLRVLLCFLSTDEILIHEEDNNIECCPVLFYVRTHQLHFLLGWVFFSFVVVLVGMSHAAVSVHAACMIMIRRLFKVCV